MKAKAYRKSEVRLDDTQALDALVACFRNAEKEEGQEKETRHSHFNPLSKRLVLGTIMVEKAARTVVRAGHAELNAVITLGQHGAFLSSVP